MDDYVIYKWERMKKYTAIYYISRWKSPGDILYCTKCFKWSEKDFDIHHLNGRWDELTYDPFNLCLLCRSCHIKAEMNMLDQEVLRKREQYKIKNILTNYSDYYDT